MPLKHGHIRWAFDLRTWKPTLSELRLATACIQCEEKIRLAKFIYRNDFDASLIGRLMMRAFVKRCVPNVDYNHIKFGRDARGKPYLLSDDSVGNGECSSNGNKIHIDFNVSHHESYVVLAGLVTHSATADVITTLSSVGVDVMKMEYTGGKSLNEYFRIMNRIFTEDEWRYIKSRRDNNEKIAAYMRNWCLKEAFTKNIGIGILTNLQRINFSIKTDCLNKFQVVVDSTVDTDGDECRNWIFEESLLDDQHCVAVAIQNPSISYLQGDRPLFQPISFTKLMEHALPLLEEDVIYCQNVMAKEYKRTRWHIPFCGSHFLFLRSNEFFLWMYCK